MKSMRVVQATILLASFGLALAAGAVEKDGKPAEPTVIPATVAEIPPVDAKQAAWQTKEIELIKVLKETVKEIVKSSPPDRNANWDLVESNVKKRIYAESKHESEGAWPAVQAGWVTAAYNALANVKSQAKEKFKRQQEFQVLESLNTKMAQLAKDFKPQSEPEKVVKQEDEENPWRYRDKNGSRTTKARYKGQEPLN